MTLIHLLLLSLFPGCVIAAALKDATSFTIPNRISIFAALAFFPAALGLGLAPGGLAICVGVGAAALVAGVAMFALGWIGGGDAKLFAACALWLGWPAFLPFLLWTTLAGGALAVTLLGARKAPLIAGIGPAWVGRLLTPGGDVPYGVAIAAGALVAFPQSALVEVFRGAI
jgi:prepilin peptidase CpaA